MDILPGKNLFTQEYWIRIVTQAVQNKVVRLAAHEVEARPKRARGGVIDAKHAATKPKKAVAAKKPEAKKPAAKNLIGSFAYIAV